MSAQNFDKLVNQIVTDDAFAARLAAQPDATLRASGIQPTPDLLDALKGVDVAALRQLAGSFKQGQAAAS